MFSASAQSSVTYIFSQVESKGDKVGMVGVDVLSQSSRQNIMLALYFFLQMMDVLNVFFT